MTADARQIRALVLRGALCLRARRALDRTFELGIAGALLVAAVFMADRWAPLDAPGLRWALAAAIALPLAGLAWGALQPVHGRRVATAMDAANDLNDRLGIAWGLTDGLRRPATGAFAAAAVRDAAGHAGQARAAAAFPLSPPGTWRALTLALAAAGLAVGLRVPAPPPGPGLLPRAAASPVDPEVLAEHGNDAQALADEAEALEDRRLGDVAQGLTDLVEALDSGKLELKRAFERLRDLEGRLAEGAVEEDRAARALKDAMVEMAKALKKARAPETEALAEALAKGDLEKARKQLERLASLLDNPLIPKSLVKKLAKALEKAAKKLQGSFDQGMRKELAAELKRLKKLLRKQGLSEREDQRMKDLQRQLAARPRAAEGSRADPGPSPERAPEGAQAPTQGRPGESKERRDAPGGASRAVNRLSRRMKEAGKKLERGDPKDRGEAADDLQKGANDIRSMHRAMRRQQARQQAERRMSQLKEAMRRGQRGGKRQRQMAQQRRALRRRSRGGGSPPPPGRGRAAERRDGQGRASRSLHRGKPEKPGGGPGVDPGDKRPGQAGRMKTRRKDQHVSGKESGGPMDQEIILGAAERGFAKTEYRDVFTKYRDVREEELARDRVPAGYRRYVYRYFDLIRPGGDAGPNHDDGGAP